ncbi:MAG: hypothetical protein FWD72_03725, partial [Eggerthellaceae bacterium]|nr:hypothetical protein [Eggerthellaceae bacterium]
AYIVAGVVVVALVIHGFGMKMSGRTKGGAAFELERKWDKNHPEAALGAAEAAKKAAEVQGNAVHEEAAVAEAAETAEAAVPEPDEAVEQEVAEQEVAEQEVVEEAAEAEPNEPDTTEETEEGGDI